MAIRLSPSRVTSAVVPSREKIAWLGPDVFSPSAILPAGVSVLPLMVKTETVPSLRLATKASVAARLIETPAAPAPACSVARTFGGEDFRSITVSLSSAIALAGSAGSIFIAPVTSAKLSSGAIATLGGGPTTLAGTGNSATMRGGAAARSMIEMVSGSGSLRTVATPLIRTILPSLAEMAISARHAGPVRAMNEVVKNANAVVLDRIASSPAIAGPLSGPCRTVLGGE